MRELTFWECVAIAVQTAIATLPLVIAFGHERIGRFIKERWCRHNED